MEPEQPQVNPEAPATEAPPEVVERPPFDEVMSHLDHYVRNDPELRKALRSHDVVAGIAGDIAHGITQQQQAENTRAAQAKAAEDALNEQLRLADEDPEAFAAQFKEETRAKIVANDLRNIALAERTKLSEALGRAFDDLPDGKMDKEEVHELAQALIGVPEDRVFAAYAAKRTDLIARRRASTQAEAKLSERIAAEKEAWEAEQSAKRAKTSPAPSVRGGNAAGNDSGEPDFRKDPAGWNAWYEQEHGLRRRVTAS